MSEPDFSLPSRRERRSREALTNAEDGRPVAVLEARDISKHFEVRDALGRTATVRAVENVTLQLHRGHILALVGESGSGKTTVAKLLAQFYPVTSGEIRLDGALVSASTGRPPRAFYRRVQMIFQDPFGSLNSMHKVRYNLERALRIHGHARGREDARRKALDLLEKVALTPAEEFAEKYPYQLSGGQRQRVVIARALAVQPAVLLGDEPISMLDVSIRLDMLNLLARLRDEEELALLYITHDIASARYIADQIAVMYAGQMVESGPSESVIAHPRHPYTQLLIESSPDPERVHADGGDNIFRATEALGEPPSLVNPPSGCRFHPRCPLAQERCRTTSPPRVRFEDGQWADCWALVPADADAEPHEHVAHVAHERNSKDPEQP